MLVYSTLAGDTAVFAAGDYIVYILHGTLQVDVMISVVDIGFDVFKFISYNFSAVDSSSSKITPKRLDFTIRLPVKYSGKDIQAIGAEIQRNKYSQKRGAYNHLHVNQNVKCRIWRILQAIHKHMY